ncbi:hypothetical protein VHEMI02688 [[Torrubiella] hemipterigena]|uniref:F-box domain-containing protein n=1 Tax=[Torrubiella] hemipterigena TaxID=1531966 RepID=A0A0A1T8R2_9HYPO|nr:hypothetical protein VHEMI02688 [[Torrubiella] hemipterigena]
MASTTVEANMRTAGNISNLPPEILIHIMETALPRNDHQLLPATHTCVKTLLSWLLVCRFTYQQASRLLRDRYVYLDSEWKLDRVLLHLSQADPASSLPLVFRNVTSMYLAPFGNPRQHLQTVTRVRNLLYTVSGTLRRLVLELPSVDADTHSIQNRMVLQGLLQLQRLEEYVEIGDYTWRTLGELSTPSWPALRRLTFCGDWFVSTEHIGALARFAHLESIVFAVTDSQDLAARTANIKKAYFEQRDGAATAMGGISSTSTSAAAAAAAAAAATTGVATAEVVKGRQRGGGKDIRVTLMAVGCEVSDLVTTDWDKWDAGETMKVDVFTVPVSYYGDESESELVCSWVRRGALEGSIWDWGGEEVRQQKTAAQQQ